MERLEFSAYLAQASDHNILKIAAKRGIQYPSPHLALFKAVYAKLEEANGNGVRLATKAVKDSLPTLVGKQVNFNHQRQNAICGYILDAWLNDSKEIEICFAFFKDVYPEEYQEALELMEEGKLTVSFELNSEKSSQEHLQDGSRRLNDINFAGVGLLLKEKPAYAGAKVFETAKKLVSYIFNPEGDLVCANKNEYQELIKALSNVRDNNLSEGDVKMSVEKELRIAESINDEVKDVYAKKLSYHEKKNLPDSSFAVVIKKDGRTIRKFPLPDAAHVRNALARLGQEPTINSLKRLGVSVESVKRKVLARAKALGLHDLVKRHEQASENLEKSFQDNVTCMKCGARFDWNSYVNADKSASKCPGCEDMVDKNGMTIKAKEGANMSNEEKIEYRKAELGELAKDWKNEDFLDEAKYEDAKKKKEPEPKKVETQADMEKKIDSNTGLDKPVKIEAPQPAGTCTEASQVPETPASDPTQVDQVEQKKLEVKVEEKIGLSAPEKIEAPKPVGLEAPVAGSEAGLSAPKKIETPETVVPEADKKTAQERQAEAIAEAPKVELPSPEKKLMTLKIEYRKAKLGEFAKDMKDEDLLDKSKYQAAKALLKAYKTQKSINRVETEEVDPKTGERVNTTKHVEHTVNTDSEGNKSHQHVEHTHKESWSQAEMEAVREEYEAAIPPEVLKRVKELVKEGKPMKDAMKEAWADYKKDMKKASETVGQLKAELDPKFTENWTEADYLDPVKVENARLKQENAQLKATQVVAKKEETSVVTATQEPAVELETGHDEINDDKNREEKVDVAAAINSRVKIMRFGKKNKK